MDIEKLKIRSQIVKLIRQWFDEQSFLEIQTPRLVGLPGQEPYLEPFWTSVIEEKGISHPAALITSPEYAMKRLLAAGLDKIYDLGPCFRNNEPWDGTHDPEFLLLEWYRREAGLEELMQDTEGLIKYTASHLPATQLNLDNSEFRRLTVEQAWQQYADVDLVEFLNDRDAFANLAERKFNQAVTLQDGWDDIYFKIFLSYIEPKLGVDQPTFLYRYPISQAALARKSANDSHWADRVELYIANLELANGFAELCDMNEQRKRFLEERDLRSKQGKLTWDLDENFLFALPKMGNAAGMAFGVDRLAMLLVGAKSINEVIPYSARERFLK